jgi:ribosomal-protein-alanine N-acetyltransferase
VNSVLQRPHGDHWQTFHLTGDCTVLSEKNPVGTAESVSGDGGSDVTLPFRHYDYTDSRVVYAVHGPTSPVTTPQSGGRDGPLESDDVRIRAARRADLLSVYRIEKNVFPQPWPYAAFEGLLDAPAFLVAERLGEPEPMVDPEAEDHSDGSGIVGYVVGDSTPNHGRDIGHVKDIAVRPDAQGDGVGRLLLRRALRRLASRGAAVVKLEVRESNTRAQRLYDSEGFDPVRREPRYYGDGEAAYVMAVDLGDWIRNERAE